MEKSSAQYSAHVTIRVGTTGPQVQVKEVHTHAGTESFLVVSESEKRQDRLSKSSVI